MILNHPMNLPNDTFGWLVAQVLSAEAAKQRALAQNPPTTSREGSSVR